MSCALWAYRLLHTSAAVVGRANLTTSQAGGSYVRRARVARLFMSSSAGGAPRSRIRPGAVRAHCAGDGGRYPVVTARVGR